MEISGVTLQSTLSGNSAGQKSDPSAEIQRLEQKKEGIEQQLKKLENSKQGADTIKNAKDKLQKQVEEIDEQIQVLRQQGTSEVQPTEEGKKPRPPRFDEYVKNDKEASSAGLYSVKHGENGNSLAAKANAASSFASTVSPTTVV